MFVQNYRRGVPARLGLDYASLRPHNPRLIYASVSGYGPEGPDAAEPSFDQMGATILAYGLLAAIEDRSRTQMSEGFVGLSPAAKVELLHGIASAEQGSFALLLFHTYAG